MEQTVCWQTRPDAQLGSFVPATHCTNGSCIHSSQVYMHTRSKLHNHSTDKSNRVWCRWGSLRWVHLNKEKNGCQTHLFFAFHLSISPWKTPPLGVVEERLSLSQRPPVWINLQCFTFLIPVPLSSVPLSFHSLKIRRSYLARFRTGLYVITELLPLCEEHQGDGGP